MHIIVGVMLVLFGNLVILGFRELSGGLRRARVKYEFMFVRKQSVP